MNTARVTMMEAIVKKKIVAAEYNGMQIKLAPHMLFKRHDDLFVRAVNMNKNQSADEVKLGQFKLAGLVAAELLEEGFDPVPAFDGAAPRPDDTVLMLV